MKHSVNKAKSISSGTVFEYVNFQTYGRYNVNSDKESLSIFKITLGKDCVFGHDYYRHDLFDAIGARKKAYHTSNNIILSHLRGKNHYGKTITDNKKVPIYKKKKK